MTRPRSPELSAELSKMRAEGRLGYSKNKFALAPETRCG